MAHCPRTCESGAGPGRALAHRAAQGARPARAIIFGLQSFGEGIDLPGSLCKHVVIDKLPFTPPSSPAEESLVEWLMGQRRDPFNNLSVPRVVSLCQRAPAG
nr:helicase C-terminal domain-containing protein [Polaromonas glacialis]